MLHSKNYSIELSGEDYIEEFAKQGGDIVWNNRQRH